MWVLVTLPRLGQIYYDFDDSRTLQCTPILTCYMINCFWSFPHLFFHNAIALPVLKFIFNSFWIQSHTTVHVNIVSFCISVSLYPSVSLCLCHSLSLSLSFCLFHSVCLYVSLYVCLCLSVCLSLCLSLPLSLSLSLSVSVCLPVSLPVSLSLSLSLSISLHLPPSLCHFEYGLHQCKCTY